MKSEFRKGKVFYDTIYAGVIEEMESGYAFTYDSDYLLRPDAQSISLTLPLQKLPFTSTTFFPFFDGLISEGWLLSIVVKNWKMNVRDRMGLLLVACSDCIGAISVEALQ